MNLKKALKDAANSDDILYALGLERRSTGFARFAGSIGLLAAGVAVGAGVAMLFAPRPGYQTREQLGQRVSSFKDEVGSRVREALRDARQRGKQEVSDIETDIEEVGGTRGI